MAVQYLDTARCKEQVQQIRAGDRVFLSGTVYTARDAAHKKLCALLNAGEALPFPLDGACIYYAGPTPARPGQVIGACGPTTSSRMDPYAPLLLHHGLKVMIGKGGRNEDVCRAIRETGGLYLCAVGGAGALAAKCVTSCEEIAFPEFGCESIKRLTVREFPLIAAIDCAGGSLFCTAE